MTFSVAMATYNGSRFLEEQLSSLAQQTFLPIELIVCDDQSVDKTQAIVNAFSKSAPFEVAFVLNQMRLGYRANFMKAASLCKGDFIAFSDQDDFWRPNKLEVVFANLTRAEAIFLEHNFCLMDESGRLFGEVVDANAASEGGPWSSSLGFTQVFHRSLLSHSDLWPCSVDHYHPTERMAHDQWLSFLAPLLGPTVKIDEPLVYHRQHSSNTFGYAPHQPHRTEVIANYRALLRRQRGDSSLYEERRSAIIDTISFRIASANSRIAVIEALLERVPQERIDVLSLTLQYYKALSSYQSRRLQIYHLNDWKFKLKELISLHSDGSYLRRRARGIKDGVLDFLYGLNY